MLNWVMQDSYLVQLHLLKAVVALLLIVHIEDLAHS